MSEHSFESGPFEVTEDCEVPIKPFGDHKEGDRSVLLLHAGQRFILKVLGEAKIVD